MGPTEQDREKQAAAAHAVQGVREGMALALGSGSTVEMAARALAERFPRGTGLRLAVASEGMESRMRSLGLPLTPLSEIDRFDLMLDGADEVDPELDLLKGGGWALFREKLLARMSRSLEIMVDRSKLVDHIGRDHPLPLEIVPFARPYVLRELSRRGLEGHLRRRPDGTDRTDNGNEILDVKLPGPSLSLSALDQELRTIPGVVETGLFLGMAARVYVGLPSGKVEVRQRP